MVSQYGSCISGREAAKLTDSYAGKGCVRKLTPYCNDMDSGVTTMRKHAHFTRVFNCEINC